MDELLRKFIELGAYAAQLEECGVNIIDIVGEEKSGVVHRLIESKYPCDDGSMDETVIDFIKARAITLVDEIIAMEAM